MANFKHIAATLALLGSASFAVTGCGDKKPEGTEVPGGDSAVEKADGSCGGEKAEGSCSGDKAEGSCSGEAAAEGGEEAAAEGGEEAPAEGGE